MASRTFAVLAVALGALEACDAGPTDDCGVGGPAAPTTVRVSRSDVADVPLWGVSELWRTDGTSDEAQLTQPTSGRVAANGTLAVPDFGAGVVWLLGADGRWLEPAGRRGQGPGELLAPVAAAWDLDGRLLVLDLGNAKVERYDLASGTSETLPVPADLVAPAVLSGQVGPVGLRGDGVAFLQLPADTADVVAGRVAFASGGSQDDVRRTVWESFFPPELLPSRLSLPEWPRPLLAVGVEGWAVAPSSDRYEVVLFGASDEPERRMCVADQEVFEQPASGGESVPDWLLAEYEELPISPSTALFARIVIDRDGRLWVERDLPQTGSNWDGLYGVAAATLDVLSPEGELLGRAEMPAGLRFQDARGDTLWAYEMGELDEVSVVAAEITR